jgi:hypothetical protein
MCYITRTGVYKGYDQRVNEIPSELVTGGIGNMPSWVKNYREFWKSTDKYERANARLAQEIEIALPVELNRDQQIKLVQGFVSELCGAEGTARTLPYTWAIHNGKGHNPHAHILFSERINDRKERPVELWFKRANPKNPELGGATKARRTHDKDFVPRLREAWAKQTNTALKEAGIAARIDPRSHLDRNLPAIPGRHRGLTRIVTRSREMDPMETYLDVDHHNASRHTPGLELVDLYAKLRKLEQDKAARMGLTLPLEGKKAPERDGGRGGR